MPLTQETQYAIRAVYDLARFYGHGPVRAQNIAERQAIPHRFLEAILHRLGQKGIVEAKRGRGGGHLLARPPAEIRVIDVLQAIGHGTAPTLCIELGEDEAQCPLSDNCALRDLWLEAQEAVEQVYRRHTFEDLIKGPVCDVASPPQPT